MPDPGQIVILNGVPRAGKSSIVAVIQETFDGPWMNLGVDVFSRFVTPPRYQPGMGLRPGGERPEIEAHLPAFCAALYDSVAAHSRQGLPVVVDVGHHDAYSAPLDTLADAARRLAGLPTLFVGVRCPIDVIMQRRSEAQTDERGRYLASGPGDTIPPTVLRWQEEVHRDLTYDLGVDTSVLTAAQCAEAIRQALEHPPSPSAFERLALRAPS